MHPAKETNVRTVYERLRIDMSDMITQGEALARLATSKDPRYKECGERFAHVLDVVEIMKLREFRKDFFINECVRIGTLLAERMEDAEGWHDVSRIEPAKRELAGVTDGQTDG